MFDLHVHTTASDGELSPIEVVKLAKDLDVSTISITDHDTVEGLEEGIYYGNRVGLEVIPGIELNAKVSKGKMHILGYYINYKDKAFVDKMYNLKRDRDSRNDKLIFELRKMGINVTIEDVKKYAFGNILAKPHFARVLLENGYISDIEEAYSKFFNVPPMSNIKRESINPKDAIEIIKSAGGIAVLAHPVTLKLEYYELDKTIKELKKIGLDGIECYNNIHTTEEVKMLKEIAKNNEMIVTAGSDFHGPISTPNVQIGRGRENNIISDIPNLLMNLKNKRSIYYE